MERIKAQGFICGFSEREMAVNAPYSLDALRHRARLHLTITTPRGAALFPADPANDKATIELQIHIGEGASNMFTPDDTGGYGTIVCPGFIVKGWEPSKKSNRIILCKLIQDEAALPALQTAQALTLVWTDICSTAPEGICTVKVELSCFPGMETHTYECRLFKVAAPLQINYFEAQPGCGNAGQKILLKWQVENAQSGYILPGGYDIFKQGVQSTSTCEVVLDEAIDRYYLHIANERFGAFRAVNVFTVSPYIAAFTLKGGTVSWETHFANTVEFACDRQPYSAVPQSGECPLTAGTKLISLRCKGAGRSVSRHICIPAHLEIRLFELEKQVFENHKNFTARWETEGLRSASLRVWDTRSYAVSTQPGGVWEQAYRKENVALGLAYTSSDGVSGMEEIDRE